MVDWVDECYVYDWNVMCMLGSSRRKVVSLLPVLKEQRTLNELTAFSAADA